MAILNDLLVKGCSRFLQQIYVNDDMSVSGTLVLSKTQNATGTADNGPALIVGGTRTAAHLELDNNELMAKGSGTTTADLYINSDGGNVYIAKSDTTTQIQGLLKVQGNSTFTGAATFNGNLTANGTTALKNVSISSDLTVANNARIEKTLIVEEEIRSPKWIIDNIANLGGEFVIAPTIVCRTSVSVTVAGPSSNQYTITVTDSSITSTSFGGIAWSNGSVVKVSGTINGVVFVSVNGTMSQALNTTTNTIQFKVSSNDIVLTAGTYTGDKVKNLHIMMYKVGGTVPVGIFMTSYGANKYPYVEIYSGTETNTLTTRLGYLDGLPAIVNNISPSGWGLYTNNGFFSGTIVSTSGKIGGWTLGTNAIYNNTNSLTSTAAGLYLGTTGIRNYKDTTHYVNVTDGVITALGVNLTGTINATAGYFGSNSTNGWSISSNSIKHGTLGSTGGYILNAAGNSSTSINGTSRSNLTLAIGSKFAVGNDGTLYANGANVTNINASNISSGSISADCIKANVISAVNNGTGTIDANKINVSEIEIGNLSGASDYSTTSQMNAAILANGIEYIAGTQTAATNVWTGVTKETVLVAGKTIAYHLPFAGTGTAATLTLTLANGSKTAAIGVKFNSNNSAANNVTTHYGAGSVINMTYDGTYWRVAAGYYDTTGIGYARYRTQNPNNIKAAAACTANHIICGTSSGYRNIAANVSFDLNYALMWCGTSIAANETGTNNYLTHNGVNVKTSGTVESVTQYSTVYLKGTVDGKTFKIAASNFLTCKVPTSDDGFAYIPLGIAYNTTPNIYFNSSSDVFAFRNGAFQKLDSVAKYITAITDSGIRVHAKSNPTQNYAQIDADGLDVIKNGVSIAQFGKSDEYGPSTRIGQESKTHITIATSESEDTSGSSGYDHEKIAASEIKLYNTDGTKPNLKLYDSAIESYDDGENSNYYSYEVAGIDFGENGNKSVFGPTMDERSTGSTIRSVIGEDDTLLEILTGNTQSHRSAGTYIESARQWTSNTNYNDLAAIQTQVAEGGIMPSVYLHTISGLSSAALNVYANGTVGGVAIVADEVTLNDAYGHSTGCYITHGWVGQDTATNANSYRDVTVQFNHTYSSSPHVIATIYSTSTSPTIGSIQVAVYSVSTTSATIRIFNNTSSGRSPGFYWLAIG